MANYRKKVRDALVTVLSDATNGFNAKLAALVGTYGITAFTIDWSLPSNNFVMGFLDPEDVEVSEIVQFPAAVIYTGNAVDDRKAPGTKFAGQVIAALDMYLRYHALTDKAHAGNVFDDGADTESIADAVEDAVSEALVAGRSTFQTQGVVHSGYRVDRDSIQPHGDGHSQRLKFTLGFEVRV